MKVSMVLLAAVLAASGAARASDQDWTRFGWNAQRTSAPGASMGVTESNVARMKRQQVTIDGTVDASAIYLKGVEIGGARHDAFFVTTTYGKTIALDADSGERLWEFTPPGYSDFAGTPQITTATPVADPDRRFLYAAAPDGKIRKLAVADGSVAWSTAITKLPQREKIASALNYYEGRVIATTGGYVGDRPPYQGHVAVIEAKTGRLEQVWNALCSDRAGLIQPSSCPESGAAIWGRAGAVVDPATGNLYVATGNARWDGRRYWGDSVIELSPGAGHLLGNFTPEDTHRLDVEDEDLGSTSPALLDGLVAQGGKDKQIRLLAWSRMRGTAPHRGGSLSRVPTPSPARLYSALAVLRKGGETWVFAADARATAGWVLSGRKLDRRWRVATGGSSPVVADGLVFAYDPIGGGLNVYEAKTGARVARLECGGGHWNSPIVADGRIALPEGNSNDHRTSGVLDIWRLP